MSTTNPTFTPVDAFDATVSYNQRRHSLPINNTSVRDSALLVTGSTEEHTEVNFDTLESFLEEIIELHSYGVELLKHLKQKYMKKPANLNAKIKQLQVMIDEVFTEESATLELHDEY